MKVSEHASLFNNSNYCLRASLDFIQLLSMQTYLTWSALNGILKTLFIFVVGTPWFVFLLTWVVAVWCVVVFSDSNTTPVYTTLFCPALIVAINIVAKIPLLLNFVIFSMIIVMFLKIEIFYPHLILVGNKMNPSNDLANILLD